MPSTQSTLPISDMPALQYDHSSPTIASLIRTVITQSHTIAHSTVPSDLLSKSSTPHSPAPSAQLPKAVFYPRSTRDTSIILKACHEHKVAITAFSGGTSLPGALANVKGGVCVDFGEMREVRGNEEGDLDVWVQAGVGWVELNHYLKPQGLFFPVDPAPGARIGGMIAMSCSGTNAYRYGTMKEWVISLTAVLPDGTIIKTRNRPRKSSAGYDLNHLLIGSEGTLALVTEAILKVTALPQNLHVGMATFHEMQHGVDTAITILRSGHQLEAIELMDKPSTQAINHSGLASERLVETPTLFVKFAGSRETVTSQICFLQETCAAHSSLSVDVSGEQARIDSIWGARKCLGNAFVSMKKTPSDIFLSTDAAVPISRMARLVEQSERIVRAEAGDWFCASVGHVGDGNVHTAIVCPGEAREKAEKVLEKIQRLALDLEGTITGEHGIGTKLRGLLVEEVGPEGVDLMRRVKMAVDPRGILNPDKVVVIFKETGVAAKL